MHAYNMLMLSTARKNLKNHLLHPYGIHLLILLTRTHTYHNIILLGMINVHTHEALRIT